MDIGETGPILSTEYWRGTMREKFMIFYDYNQIVNNYA